MASLRVFFHKGTPSIYAARLSICPLTGFVTNKKRITARALVTGGPSVKKSATAIMTNPVPNVVALVVACNLV